MDIEEKREHAKSLGIKQTHNMKNETLDKKIQEVENPPKKRAADINVSKDDVKYFDNIGFESEWLASLANQYDFDNFVYVHKFRAFRCYRKGRHLDWINLNELGLLYKKAELTKILMSYQPLQKERQIINLPWRR